MRSEYSALKAVLIVAYFAVTTVWLPSALLRSPLLSGATRVVADTATVLIWGLFFGTGVIGLRRAQEGGWI